MKRWFQRVVLSRPWLTFVVLGVSFLCFGAGTLNLFFLLRANSALVFDYGWQALMDGAARQLFELMLTAFGSMLAYVVFKTCEVRLVRWLLDT
jgi:uncharacterized membrane protein HdeD (DUF308 family)